MQMREEVCAASTVQCTEDPLLLSARCPTVYATRTEGPHLRPSTDGPG